MHAASRDALAAVREKTAELTGDAAGAVGGDLFSIVALIDDERTLRRALADGSTEPAARESLIKRILEGKVGDAALEVVTTAVAQQWSASADLADSLELVGREALLRSAQEGGQLDAVEDELFRLGRIIEGSPELERALGDRTRDPDRKRELMATLVRDKLTEVTAALVDQLVARQRESLAEGLDGLARLAATQREKSVAHVRTPITLSDEQERRLADSLSRAYGREVTLHVEVDPALMGGLVIQVGDEIIDGSIAGRLDALRRKLAG